MASLGAPRTTKFCIGAFEVRVGPLTEANRLNSSHSIGLVDSVHIETQADSTDLLTGTPPAPEDTVIIKSVVGMTASLREYSWRNMNLLLGKGALNAGSQQRDDWVKIKTNLGPINDGETTLVYVSPDGPWNALGSQTSTAYTEAKFQVDDTLVIHSVDAPTKFCVCRIAACGPTVITLDPGTPIYGENAEVFAQHERVYAYQASTISGAMSADTNYFSVQLYRLDRRTGIPVGFNFWKAALSSGSSMAATPTEFSSSDLVVKFLRPRPSDYVAGGPLDHLANVIPRFPIYQMFDVGDNSRRYELP